MTQRVRIPHRGQASFVCHSTPHFGSTSRRVSYSVPPYHTRWAGKSKYPFLKNPPLCPHLPLPFLSGCDCIVVIFTQKPPEKKPGEVTIYDTSSHNSNLFKGANSHFSCAFSALFHKIPAIALWLYTFLLTAECTSTTFCARALPCGDCTGSTNTALFTFMSIIIFLKTRKGLQLSGISDKIR